MSESPRVVVIRRFLDPFEASVSITALHAADIPAVLRNEHISTFEAGTIAVGGIEVLVPATLAQEADAILSQAAQPAGPVPPLPDSIASPVPVSVSDGTHAICPRCGSSDVAIHARFRRLAAALAVAGLPLMSALKRRRCRVCGCLFPVHARA